MTWQRNTAWFVVLITALILIYDAFAYWQGGIGATISHLMVSKGHSIEAIPFAWGLLMGHFFL